MDNVTLQKQGLALVHLPMVKLQDTLIFLRIIFLKFLNESVLQRQMYDYVYEIL